MLPERMGDRWVWNDEAFRGVNTVDGVYNRLNLVGARAAVVGPYYLPYDVSALQLASSVGPRGIVYSIDTQGPPTREFECVSGGGNSTKLGEQLQLLRNFGVPLAPFEWLEDSEITYFPPPAQNLDVIVDHGSLEFIGTSSLKRFHRRAVETIIGALRPGGLWIHHASTRTLLDVCKAASFNGDDPFRVWVNGLGIRVVRVDIPRDSYRIPAPDAALEKFIWSRDSQYIVGEGSSPDGRRMFMVGNGSLLFPEPLIVHPQKHIFVVQKIALT